MSFTEMSSNFIRGAFFGVLKTYPSDMTVAQLIESLSQESRGGDSDVVASPSKAISMPVKDKKTGKAKKKVDKPKKKRRKRGPTAFNCFMRKHRAVLKELLGRFVEEHDDLPIDTVVYLLCDSTNEQPLDDCDSLLESANDCLDEMKSNDKFSEWCEHSSLEEEIPSDADEDFLKKQSFSGRNVLTKTQKLGGMLWEWLEDKSEYEEESAKAKAKIAEEEDEE